MAIFNYGNNEGYRDEASNSSTTIITKGASLKGEMNLECDLYVDGHFEGSIDSSKSITIGKNGKVEGEIRARHLIVQGVAEGSLEADRIEIKESGRISGMVASNELIIEPKAIFEGESRIKDIKESEKTTLEVPKKGSVELPKGT